MIKILFRDVKANGLKKLDEFKAGSWLYVENPKEKDLLELAAKFNLDAGLLKDSIDFYEMPRIVNEDDVTYVFIQFPYTNDDSQIITLPALFVIGRDFFITISEKPIPGIGKFKKSELDFFTTHKTKLLVQVLNEINLEYNFYINNIIKEVKGSTVKLENITNKDVLLLVSHEEVLNNFLSVLLPINTVLSGLLTGKFLKLFEEDEDLLEDVYLSNGQIMEICKANLKNIVNIRDAYSTIMTNNLNRVIRLLTSLTVVLMVPNIISGLYGMNIKLPFAESPQAFWQITLTISFLTGLILMIFVRKRWF